MAFRPVTPEMLAQIESLELRARTLIDSVYSGAHRSRQKGFAIDFAEHRDYSPGDDVRFLDWKLYGRRDRFYIRQYEDESQLQVCLLLDLSGSMHYQSQSAALSKLEYATSLAAAVGWIACYQRDRASLLAYDSKVQFASRPLFGMLGARRMISELERVTAASIVSPAEDEEWHGLQEAIESIPQNTIVILFTDVFGDLNFFQRLLSQLHHRRCDVRLVQILDPAELDFPFTGNMLFRDLEGGGDQLAMAQAVRVEYQLEFEAFLDDLQKVVGQTNCLAETVVTTMPVDKVLRRILHVRSRR